MSSISIRTVYEVVNEHNKKRPWTPATQVLDGRPFVKLNKWCREWTRFVTGSALNLRKSSSTSTSCEYWNTLLDERDKVSIASLKEHLVDDNDAESVRAWKKRKVKMADASLAPKTILFNLPKVQEHGNTLQAEALWGVKSPDIWVELTADVLEHIRQGILESRATIQESNGKGAV